VRDISGLGRKSKLLQTQKVHIQQESRAVARKPRDAAAVLFGLNFADNFTTSLRVAKLRKPGFRAPNIPTKTVYRKNGHSGSFKVTCFGVSGKAIND